jgi:hypothetical protein
MSASYPRRNAPGEAYRRRPSAAELLERAERAEETLAAALDTIDALRCKLTLERAYRGAAVRELDAVLLAIASGGTRGWA